LSLKQNVIDGVAWWARTPAAATRSRKLALTASASSPRNYKAEYEQAGGAVVVATTRSGGKELHGELLATGQNQYLLEQDYFSLKRGEPPADLGARQLAAALGGPLPLAEGPALLLRHLRGQLRAARQPGDMGNPTPENQARFGSFEGPFPSPSASTSPSGS